MNSGRPFARGLLLLIAALSACTSEAATPPQPSGVAALPSYEAPAGAPAFCRLLAGSAHITAIPSALGRLTVDTSDAAARQELAGAVPDLRAVLDDVRFSVEHADLETAVEDLVDALTEASSGRPTAGSSETIAAALSAVADLAQPACEFPT